MSGIEMLPVVPVDFCRLTINELYLLIKTTDNFKL